MDPQDGMEQRVDWAMRQYVDRIVEYLLHGGDRANAGMNMLEYGVPLHVQRRILDRAPQPPH